MGKCTPVDKRFQAQTQKCLYIYIYIKKNVYITFTLLNLNHLCGLLNVPCVPCLPFPTTAQILAYVNIYLFMGALPLEIAFLPLTLVPAFQPLLELE